VENNPARFFKNLVGITKQIIINKKFKWNVSPSGKCTKNNGATIQKHKRG
jgi:hypothetical protein